MNNTLEKTEETFDLKENHLYQQVNTEITEKWPNWKKEAYNEMFAISTHASKVIIK